MHNQYTCKTSTPTQLVSLDKRVTELETTTVTIQESVNDFNEQIANIEALTDPDLILLNSRVSTLETNDTLHTSQINNNAAIIGSLTTSVGSNTNSISLIETDITNIETSITDINNTLNSFTVAWVITKSYLNGALVTYNGKIYLAIADSTGSYPDVSTTNWALIDSSNIKILMPYLNSISREVNKKLSELVSITDFGAIGDGVAYDRLPSQYALNTGKAVFIPTPSNSYLLNDSISPVANQKIYGEGRKSLFKTIDGSVNGIVGTSVTGVTIKDIRFQTANQSNATAYRAFIIAYSGSNNWLVDNVSFEYFGHWGYVNWNSSNNIIQNCRFSTAFGNVQDSCDLVLAYSNSNYNKAIGNYCFGTGADHGLMVQSPYDGSQPVGNEAHFNVVGEHNGNGLLVYYTSVFDTQIKLNNNLVFNIKGDFLSGNSGSGIHLQSANGGMAVNNTIVNCCRTTTTFETQGVGHITVGTGDLSVYPGQVFKNILLMGNKIVANRGVGIHGVTSAGSIEVSHNDIISTGTDAIRGEAIRFIGCNKVKLLHNRIKHDNPNYAAIAIVAGDGQVLDGHDVSHNDVSGKGQGVSINISGTTGQHLNVNVHANNIGGALIGAAFFLQKIQNLVFTNNTGESVGTTPVFSLTDCPNTRMGFNRLYSGYTPYSIIFAGNNAGSLCDDTNILDGVVQNNDGSGVLIKQLVSSIPSGWKVNQGDCFQNRITSAGGWLFSACTTGGIIGIDAVFKDVLLSS